MIDPELRTEILELLREASSTSRFERLDKAIEVLEELRWAVPEHRGFDKALANVRAALHAERGTR